MDRMPWPGQPTDARERELVAQQLGRDPRGDIAVIGRCRYGLPGVIRTSPRLPDGTPFPTLFYLTCPVAVRDIGRIESTGRMREYERMLAEDDGMRAAYEGADERYRARRDSIAPLDDPMTAGGMPGRVKCLHALYAHEVADGNPVGSMVRAQIEPIDCPGPCVVDTPDGMRREPGHPGFGGKKRRR